MHQGGELFVYQPHLGYWRTFEGLPPPHLFEVVRQFFILLEGIYRNFKGHVKRNDKAVLQSMDMFIQDKSMPELLSCCESTCAWNKGNNLLKKRRRRRARRTRQTRTPRHLTATHCNSLKTTTTTSPHNLPLSSEQTLFLHRRAYSVMCLLVVRPRLLATIPSAQHMPRLLGLVARNQFRRGM